MWITERNATFQKRGQQGINVCYVHKPGLIFQNREQRAKAKPSILIDLVRMCKCLLCITSVVYIRICTLVVVYDQIHAIDVANSGNRSVIHP